MPRWMRLLTILRGSSFRAAASASTLALLLAIPGCRRGDDASMGATSSTGSAETPARRSDDRSSDETAFAFTAADVDAFQRGFAREIELVKAAQERGRTAKTPEERARAGQDSWEEQTAPGGAQAAGLPPERYRATRKTIVRVLETLDFQGKIAGPKEMDRSRASPEALKRLDGDPFAELTPASAAALRARLDAFVPLWVEYVNLTAVGG